MSNPVLQSDSFENAAYALKRSLDNFGTGNFEEAVREFTRAVNKQCSIAGMQVANRECEIMGEPPRYSESDFLNA